MTELLTKAVRSTTLERLRKTCEADIHVRGLAQPLQLGRGLYHLLDHIDLPINSDDLLVGRILEEVPDEQGEAFLQTTVAAWEGRAIPPWMRDGGHECFAWQRLLDLGLPGLEDRARATLAECTARSEPVETLDFLRGAVDVYQAFRNYARRYGARAREAGLIAANHCTAIAERPPQSFTEGLQLIWLVGHVYCTMLAANPTLTFGRLDVLLLPFYRRDLRAGRLTRAQAGAWIADFYAKNNLILGRGEHQMSGGSETDTGWQRNLTYDAPQYVVLGGYRKDGSSTTDELTELFLECVDPRYENPVMVLRYSRDIPDRIWRLACTRMRDNASFMVYNDENVIPAMRHCGIAAEDAIGYTMHGCNWPDVPGIQREVGNHQAVLPRYCLEALFSLDELVSIDALYERLIEYFRVEITTQCEQLRQARRAWDLETPGELRVDDCFLDGPIDQARSWRLGGVRYATLTCAISGLATAADCLAAVDELVIRSARVSLSDLQQALRDDFAGHGPLRQLCLRVAKFGQDDDRADSHAVRLLGEVLAEIDRASRLGSDDAVIVFRCLETDMRHIRLGAQMGATPDGRRAAQPLSENTSPYPGSCHNGLTAMLKSVAKLPLTGINSGALNIRLQPQLARGEEGLDKLTALLRTYFELGGLQSQLTVVSVEQLRDAQQHPEEHRDLMVRITGYSAVFVDMCRHAQDEIIRRQEMT
jgi:trans-4-hydroxy-L-proline dehydratase